MPIKSQQQFKLMQAAKNNPKIAKKTGISKKVATEMLSKTKKMPKLKKVKPKAKPKAKPKKRAKKKGK
jgi:hypothetical protein